MNATLASRAIASLHMRGGTSIGGFGWLIYGTDGEIEVTGPMLLVHINVGVPWKVRINDTKTGATQEEEFSESDPGQPAVGKIYDAYLQGKEGAWPDFKRAVDIHKVAGAIWESSETGKVIKI